MRIGSAPDHAAHAARAQRPAAAFEAAAVDATEETEPSVKGGSDTPFTHALHQGNGKKVGIHRRLEAAEVATLQQEAGVVAPADEAVTDPAAAEDGTVPVGDAGEPVPTEPAVDAGDGLEVVADPVVIAEPVVVAAPGELVVDDPFETPVLPVVPDPLEELVEETTAGTA